LDLGNGPEDKNVFLSRHANSSRLAFVVMDGTEAVCRVVTEANVIEDDEWMTVTLRFDAAGTTVDILKDGRPVLAPRPCAVNGIKIPPADRNVSSPLVGKSHWANDTMSHIGLGGLAVVEGYLSDEFALGAGDQLLKRTYRFQFPAFEDTALDAEHVLYAAPSSGVTNHDSPADTCARPSFCQFPFTYQGRGYGQCTMQSHAGVFWCGLVNDVDECLSENDPASNIPNFEYRPNERFVCGPGPIVLGLSDAPLPTSAGECAKAVLRHPACQKDAFVWSNFSSDEERRNECWCWRQPTSVECYWETPGDQFWLDEPFEYYYQLQARQELPEAGRDKCWAECAHHSRTSGTDVAHQDVGGCTTCINVLDLHLLDPSLAHLKPGESVGQWASFNQSNETLQPSVVLGARYGVARADHRHGKDYYYGYDSEGSSGDGYGYQEHEYVGDKFGPPSNLSFTSLSVPGGGPQGTGYVTFDASYREFLYGGARALQMLSGSSNSSGGLTIVAVVRFGCGGTCGDGRRSEEEECDDGNTNPSDGCSDSCTIEQGYTCTRRLCRTSHCQEATPLDDPAPPMANEGLVHLGSWPDGNDFVYLSRDGASSRVVFAIGDASSSRDDHVSCSVASDNGTIVPGQWMTLVARYSAASNSVDLLKDGRSASWRGSFGAPVACDRALRNSAMLTRAVASSYIGKRVGGGPAGADAFFHGDLMGVQIVDSYLADSAAMAIGEALAYGYSGATCCGPSIPAAPAECAICEAGKYSPANGSASGAMYFSACLACPDHSTSPPGSSHVTQCQCNAGYTNNPTMCTACGGGTYKESEGNWECAGCWAAAGSYCALASVSGWGVICPQGFYCGGGSNDRTPCPAGTYLPEQGASAASACLACESGKTSLPGASFCFTTP